MTCLVLYVVTALVFWPACDNDFLDWDDNHYVYQQTHVLNGIRWSGIRWAATAGVVGHWHPLTLISLQLDAQLFGPTPVGFHRTAVLLHAANAVLAFLSLLALTGCRGKSAIVAALFALHPMRVESVAWISERKDVLSGFFFWVTILAYTRYTAVPSLGRYAVTTLCFTFGLCSKSMLVTVPCVLLLLDYWPLGRFKGSSCDASLPWQRVIFEKIPLFVLSAVASFLNVQYQRTAISNLTVLPPFARLKNAVAGYASYVLATFWPSGLSPFYAIHEISTIQFCGSLALIMVLTSLAIAQRTRRPYVLVGWLWFLGMLVPVCGLTQCGPQARADRYTYLAQVGLFVSLTWCVAELVGRTRRGILTAICLVAVFLVGCVSVTIRLISVWHDTESMWQQAYRIDPNDFLVIRQNLIKSLFNAGKEADARQLIDQTLQTADDADSDKMVTLAMLLAVHGEHEACVQTLTKTLKHHPEKAELYSNRGKALAALGKWRDAVEDFRRASNLAPRSRSFPFYLAHALGKSGLQEESRLVYGNALKNAPNWPQTAITDAWLKSTSADPRDRVDFWPICLAEQAIEATRGTRPQYLDVLAAAYANSERYDEAITTAKLAIGLAVQARQPAFANQVRLRLELYENHQPYREPRASN